MTEERTGADRPLAPEDAEFVRRLAGAYAPRPATPQERVAFRASLDRRLERGGRGHWIPVLGGLVAAGFALALVLGQTVSAPAPGGSFTDTTPEEALLALATVNADTLEEEGGDEDLPDDYQAIASLFLGEV